MKRDQLVLTHYTSYQIKPRGILNNPESREKGEHLKSYSEHYYGKWQSTVVRNPGAQVRNVGAQMRINKKCENCAAMQMQNTITHFLYAISKESYGKSHISTVVRNVGAHVRGNCSSAVSESLHGSRSGNHRSAQNICV